MKKIMLVGRTGAGKTTLTQALKGKKNHLPQNAVRILSRCRY